jgi:hypothetical protein
MRLNTQLILIFFVVMAATGSSNANRLYYNVWSVDNGVNSSTVYLDVNTGEQGMLFTSSSTIPAFSIYNPKARVFHLFSAAGFTPSSIMTTIDMQGNVLGSYSMPFIGCAKYSAFNDTLVGATVSDGRKVTFVTIDYTTGQVRDMLAIPEAYEGEWIRSFDIDDETGRLVLLQQSTSSEGSSVRLTIWNYNTNTLAGQYRVVFGDLNYFVVHIAFSGSQLACMVGTTTYSSFGSVLLGKFSFAQSNGTVTPQLISKVPVRSYVTGFAWNPSNSLFYALSQVCEGNPTCIYNIDTYDRSGVRTSSTKVAGNITQIRDSIIV